MLSRHSEGGEGACEGKKGEEEEAEEEANRGETRRSSSSSSLSLRSLTMTAGKQGLWPRLYSPG